ncbi:ABC transporter ATP-binding protein/permease [Enorma phocaeensis]|uniref:ABC transporter ATP-binding protein/permease n=1 Tax=Enorma phocaeensis TaxID=1871019 RepID=A0A921IWX5_9ACTN|nr:ABC transporter ATP-binding protein/permease [Enorma phocaeensis]HJG37769.1 ABC transporter ATP-binding protein/permease [Enorma phocaeensis]
MMIDRRLVGLVPQSKRHIAFDVGAQWCSLVANIVLILAFCRMLDQLYLGAVDSYDIVATAGLAAGAIAVRVACTVAAARHAYLAARSVKRTLRELIYAKLLRLGPSYREQVKTSEVVQVTVEGVDQLETYFGQYLPQFFYAMLAPLTLFAVLATINLPAAAVLLACVPLIPVAIAAVQTWAKRLLSKYWGQYTELGDTFLENLQGLTTLKIYRADEFKQREMTEQAEAFRRITMRVLTMQLNSITIMDLVAYGGAAAGIAVALFQFQAGAVGFGGCLAVMLLAADYFIPMRQLGSFFHIAMNGMAASGKIFRLLDLEEPASGAEAFPAHADICCRDLGFSYPVGEDARRQALEGVYLKASQGTLTALVGESGCGKSTLAGVLMGRNRGYTGSVRVGGVELSDISTSELMSHLTYVGHQSRLFQGTVRENLLVAKPDATDDELWDALERTRLAGFLRSEQGLDTLVLEQSANLSGGQRQRLAIARALLHDTPVYIFDEAASNVDVESEEAIMDVIRDLAAKRTVLIVSHRLANVEDAGRIYVLDGGIVREAGTHGELLEREGAYAKLWRAQRELEEFGADAEVAA